MTRGLTAAQAAEYCGISENTFRATVGAAVTPMRLRGAVRWDKHAIDRHLDRLNGLDADDTPNGRSTLRRPSDVLSRATPTRG